MLSLESEIREDRKNVCDPVCHPVPLCCTHLIRHTKPRGLVCYVLSNHMKADWRGLA